MQHTKLSAAFGWEGAQGRGVLAQGLTVLKMQPASTHCGQTGVAVQTQSSKPKTVKSHRIQRWLCLKGGLFLKTTLCL